MKALAFLVFLMLTACAHRSQVREGLEDHALLAGRERTWTLVQPPDRKQPHPLVILLHGGGGDGAGMLRMTGMAPAAIARGIAVVAPDGLGRHWNDGRPGIGEGVDDVGFLLALTERLIAQGVALADRVYLAGMSNGSLMIHRLLCEHPERFAGATLVAGGLEVGLAQRCVPSKPVPVLVIQGTEDALVPFHGGEIRVLGGKSRGTILPTEETLARLRQRGSCAETPTRELLADTDPRDGTRATVVATKCMPRVVLLEIAGGGHTWPGGRQYLPEAVIGRTSRDVDANSWILDPIGDGVSDARTPGRPR